MKTSAYATLGLGAFLVSGCATDTLVFMERTKGAIAVDFGANPAEPVELTFGLKRAVLALTPPGQRDPNGERKGDSLSLLSRFKMAYSEQSLFADLTVKNGFASGKAAENLAGAPQAANALLGGPVQRGPVSDALQTRRKDAADTVRALYRNGELEKLELISDGAEIIVDDYDSLTTSDEKLLALRVSLLSHIGDIYTDSSMKQLEQVYELVIGS